jgi:hypothetical protein
MQCLKERAVGGRMASRSIDVTRDSADRTKIHRKHEHTNFRVSRFPRKFTGNTNTRTERRKPRRDARCSQTLIFTNCTKV